MRLHVPPDSRVIPETWMGSPLDTTVCPDRMTMAGIWPSPSKSGSRHRSQVEGSDQFPLLTDFITGRVGLPLSTHLSHLMIFMALLYAVAGANAN